MFNCGWNFVRQQNEQGKQQRRYGYGYRYRGVCLCKIVYHGIKTWSIVRTKVKTWTGAEMWAGGERAESNDGSNESGVPMGCKTCCGEDTRMGELEGQAVLREWRL